MRYIYGSDGRLVPEKLPRKTSGRKVRLASVYTDLRTAALAGPSLHLLYTDADDAVRQMRLIDRCYEAAGMRLRGE